MKRLTELGIKHNTDKATLHGYTEIYDSYFEKFKNPNILEIGAHYGASLRMYEEYYSGKCCIVGLDCIPDLYNGNGDNIRVIVGDQSIIEDLKKCIKTVNKYDIIIDDGGHYMRQQQKSFSFLFDYLKENGIYIIEDLHTSFHKSFNPKKIVTTLDLLAQIKRGVYTLQSPYISQNDFDRLKKQIKSKKDFGRRLFRA